MNEHQLRAFTAYCNHPSYTNYTADFKNTLDYIWYSESPNVTLSSILDMPDHEEIMQEAPEGTGLPSDIYGSDHLKIEAVFKISKDKVTAGPPKKDDILNDSGPFDQDSFGSLGDNDVGQINQINNEIRRGSYV